MESILILPVHHGVCEKNLHIAQATLRKLRALIW